MRDLNSEPIAYEDRLVKWARRQQEARLMDAKAAEIAKTLGVDLPTRRELTAATAAGDPWKLRGIPAIGGRGSVGGAIPGTKPGAPTTQPSRPVTFERLTGTGTISTKKNRGRVISRSQPRPSFTTALRQRLLDQTEGRCYLCGLELKLDQAEVEHIVPLALGGTDHETNLSAACSACNILKADRYVALDVISRKPVYIASRWSVR